MCGRLKEKESRRVILHLVPGCPRCQEITAELWWAAAGRGDRAAEAIDYGPCVRRVFGRVRRVRAVVLTSQSPAAISANPSPSIQPNLSPRNAVASSAATSGWSVP